jgi:hypothetical protein
MASDKKGKALGEDLARKRGASGSAVGGLQKSDQYQFSSTVYYFP